MPVFCFKTDAESNAKLYAQVFVPRSSSTHFAGLFVTPNTLTLTHSPYFILVLIAINTRSNLEPFQNGIRYHRMFDPNHLLSLFVLPS